MRRPSRTLTTVAVSVLLLDATLLAYAGLILSRPWLVFWSAVCVALAAIAVIAWRRYRRAMEDVAAARREMHQDIAAIRELLHRHHLHN